MLAQRSLSLAAVLALLGCGHGGTIPPGAPAPADAETPVAAEPPAAAPAVPEEPAAVHFPLCVVDTTQGLRTLDAVRRAGDPDTFTIVEGRRVSLGEAIGDVRLAGQTDWYRGRRPLEVSLGRGRLPRRFAIYDVGRIIEGGQLAFLGDVDGLPVFAASSDVAPIRAELTNLLGTELDLEKNLAASATLRASFRALEVIYVPLKPSGCVFQALVRVQTPRPPNPATPAEPAPPRPS